MVVLDEAFSENKDEDKLRGIQNTEMLLSALYEPKQTFDKKELYPDILDKASCYMRSLARNHAFQNGNKRMALLVTVTFLEKNGYEVIANSEKIYKLVEDVVNYQLEIHTIKKNLKKFVKEIPRKRIPTLKEFFEDLYEKMKKFK